MSIKNITLSAEEQLIKLAREKAAKDKKSLNSVFREWLECYTHNVHGEFNYQQLMEKLNYVKCGRHFTRDELNER